MMNMESIVISVGSHWHVCCSLQASVDQWSDLESDINLLESFIPASFDRLTTATYISSAKSAEQLETQMKLLLVCCLLVLTPCLCLYTGGGLAEPRVQFVIV